MVEHRTDDDDEDDDEDDDDEDMDLSESHWTTVCGYCYCRSPLEH